MVSGSKSRPHRIPGMLTAVANSVAQLTDPRIRAVLLKSAALTLLIFVLLWAAVAYLLSRIAGPEAWLHWIIVVLGNLASLGVTVVIFPGVSGLVVSLFLNEVAEAVEARHYPELGLVRRQSFRELLAQGLRFAGISVVLNVLALPVYVFAPAMNLLVFYVLNGYLLSREYFELVAFRRVAPNEARRLRLAHPALMLLAGVLTTFLLTVPLVNLVTPVFATALMVHLFHGAAYPDKPAKQP